MVSKPSKRKGKLTVIEHPLGPLEKERWGLLALC